MNVVLVPGILGFNRIGPLSYFSGVAQYLRANVPGIRVLETATDPVGSIASRAEFLAQ